MNKTEKAISKKIKEFYKKYKTLESFNFFIQISSDDKIYINTEDIYLNDVRWDELGNLEIFKFTHLLRNAKESLSAINNIDDKEFFNNSLELMIDKAAKQFDDSSPLLNASVDWNEFSIELLKEIEKSVKQEYPWQYIEYVLVKTKRDGTVTTK